MPEQVWTVEQVEELLSRITPGPWFWAKARTMQWLHNASGCFASISMPAFNHRGYHHRPTAKVDNELIAAAPEIIRYLLDSLTRARQDAFDEAAKMARKKSQGYRESANRWAEHAKAEELPEAKVLDEESASSCFSKYAGLLVFAQELEAARDKEKVNG